MINKIKYFLRNALYLVLRPIIWLVPIKKDRWVLGGSRNVELESNTFYFWQYLIHEQPHLDVAFVARKPQVLSLLRSQGKRAFHNYSINGLLYAITSEVYCYSLSTQDVNYVPLGKTLYINLWHGNPLKKILYDAASSTLVPTGLLKNKRRWWNPVAPESEADLILTTSEYFARFMRSAFRSIRIESLGLPRNDFLVRYSKNNIYIQSLKQKIGCRDKLIVTYLPTHRGFGKSSPKVLFAGREDAVRRKLGPNVMVITVQHPLTRCDYYNITGSVVQKIERGILTIQEILLCSDILVTDYSSAFVDYLIMDRPVLFYCYDLEQVSTDEFYFLSKNELPGKVYCDELLLLNEIFSIVKDGSVNAPQTNEFFRSRYHKYKDQKSCQRVYERINSMIAERRRTTRLS